MPPYAYYNFEVDTREHPVEDAIWRLPVTYESSVRPEVLTELALPSELMAAVTLRMDDFVAPKSCLGDIDRNNPTAVDKFNMLMAFVFLVNEPWRCAVASANRSRLFSPTTPEGEVPEDATYMHPRIRMFVERVCSREGGARDLDLYANDVTDVDVEWTMTAEQREILSAQVSVEFDLERQAMFVQAAEENGEPMEPGEFTVAVRYWFLIQDPSCSFVRGFANVRQCCEAYAAAAAASGGKGGGGGGGGAGGAFALRLAGMDARGGGKKGKKGKAKEEQEEEPSAGGDGLPTSTSTTFVERAGELHASHAFVKAPLPWEGHRALVSHEAYLRMVHAYCPEAAENPLSQNEHTLGAYTQGEGRRPKNPANPYEVFHVSRALKGLGVAPDPRNTFVKQRFVNQYMRASVFEMADEGEEDKVETILKFPLPEAVYELTYPFNKQACVWGCAFPWLASPVPLFKPGSTVESRKRETYSKMLRLESELVQMLRNTESVEGMVGVASHFEEFCTRMRHTISELKTPEERRAYRNRPEVLEQAWNMLCHSSDRNIQSVLKYFYELDRQSRADGKGPYSFWGDEMGSCTKDFALEPIANFVIKLIDDCEHVFSCISQHGAILKVYLSALGVFEPNFSLKYNVLLHGPAGTSKSFVMRVAVDYMMCGSVAWEVQDLSPKAFLTSENRNYVLVVMDELLDRVAGQVNGRKQGAGDGIWKAWLTAQRIQFARNTKTESGQLREECVDKPMIGGFCAGTNLNPNGEVVEPIVDRSHVVEVPDIERKGHNFMDMQIFEMLRESVETGGNDRAKRRSNDAHQASLLYRKVFGLTAIVNMFMKMSLLEEPSLIVATMGNARQLEALKRGGAAGGFNKKRPLLRVHKVSRTLTIAKGIIEVFCNRATAPLSSDEWEVRSHETFCARDIMMIQPYLCSNEQISALAVTTLLNQWVDPMQAYPVQQLFEHGNIGGLGYLEWLRENHAQLETKMAYETSKLSWLFPTGAPMGAGAAAAAAAKRSATSTSMGAALGGGYAGMVASGVNMTAPPYMYARFGPIPRSDKASTSFLWRAAMYVEKLIQNAGGQHMSASSIHGIFKELSSTRFDAPVYDLMNGNRCTTPRTMSMPVMRADETTEHIEFLEAWVRASYSDAHQNATVRAVSALGHAHTRPRPLLTATQIMSRRHLKVGGDDVPLPQFLEVVPVNRSHAGPWSVANSTEARTVGDLEDEDEDEEEHQAQLENWERLTITLDEDVESWALKQHLARCGYSEEESPAEYAAAMRAHSKHTTGDTLRRYQKVHKLTLEDAQRMVGVYPDAYVAMYGRDEERRREQRFSSSSGGGEKKEEEEEEEVEEEDIVALQKVAAKRTKRTLGSGGSGAGATGTEKKPKGEKFTEPAFVLPPPAGVVDPASDDEEDEDEDRRDFGAGAKEHRERRKLANL